MTPEKVREVLATYRRKFEELKVEKQNYPRGVQLDHYPVGLALAHCHAMLDKMEVFVQEGRMDKVFRWLGFLQGVLWMTGTYSIDELKNHNRKDKIVEGVDGAGI